MLQVRNGVFETNSSSTHSICICTKSDFDKWKSGELIYDRWHDKLIPTFERKDDDFYDFKTYDEYQDRWELEQYTVNFTTPSGDEMVAFGEYGYDG
jgi:hypothetical protein